MADPRTGFQQLFVELEVTPGVEISPHVLDATTVLRCEFDAPDFPQTVLALNTPRIALGHAERVAGPRGPGALAVKHEWAVKDSGSVHKTALLLSGMLGAQHNSGVWKESLTFVTSGGTTTTATVPSGTSATIGATDEGALLWIQDATTSKWHMRALKSVTDGGGVNPDTLEWYGALPNAAGGTIKCARTFYPAIDPQVSLQLTYHGEATSDFFSMLLARCSGSLTLAPGGDRPFPLFAFDFKYREAVKQVAAAQAYAADDNGEPINIAAGLEVCVNAYSGAARVNTRVPMYSRQVDVGFGLNIQPLSDPSGYAAIGGYKPTVSDDFCSVSLMEPWTDTPQTDAVAGAQKHIILSFGTASAGGGIYIPRAQILAAPARADEDGLQKSGYKLGAMPPVDAIGTAALQKAPFVIGCIG